MAQTFRRLFYITLALAPVFLITGSVGAKSGAAQTVSHALPPVDVLPATTAQAQGISYSTENVTHPEVKMTPDKSELVHLDSPATSIIVGNPNHLSVLADSAQTLVLIPRAPGATYFTVLDKNGVVIMQRYVVVASPQKKYVRVRRSCAASAGGTCQETSVFYCPDMCHQIILNTEKGSANTAVAAAQMAGDAAAMSEGIAAAVPVSLPNASSATTSTTGAAVPATVPASAP